MKITHRFVIITAVSVACLIAANVIAVKLVAFGTVSLPAAIIVFPISYIIGDILTEVYGYHMARRVIWLSFLCNLLFVGFVWIGGILPTASFWKWQEAYDTILGFTPRLLAASFAGYLVGEFVNSFIMAKMKVLTSGRCLWSRTIASTIAGEGLDTVLFIVIAFGGTPLFAPVLIFYHWVAKVLIEVLATPLTYLVVNWLKKKEKLDTYDHNTKFSPFRY